MSDYKRAGVDLAAAEEAVALIRDLAASATRPEVVEGVGGFAGLFRLGDGRLLAAGADNVGTKTVVARAVGKLDTVGIDCVAMCANDVLCTGAEPLFFLDYIAVGHLVPEEAASIVSGVAEGCRRAGCALLGGETAEYGEVMAEGRFDLAGFCVGVVDEDALLGPSRVREGDALVGLRSSGVHSNGFSLVRKVVEDEGLDYLSTPEGLARPLGEELLEPTLVYVPPVLEAVRLGLVHSLAHVTGGGWTGNLPRALPAGLGVEIDSGSWSVPPIFEFIARRGGIDRQEMFGTFNMGIGIVLVTPDPERTTEVAQEAGFEPVTVGLVVGREGVSIQ